MRDRPSAEVNSVMMSPQPERWLLIGVSTRRGWPTCSLPANMLALRMKRRNTVSVTPAIGASTVAGATVTPPISTEAGTRLAGGMACSSGLSQLFFMETFFICGLTQRRPPCRRPRVADQPRLLCGGGRLAALGLGILAAEALDASGCVHQLLLAGKEGVAAGADFHVDVALVGGTRLKSSTTRALDADFFVVWMY